MKSLILMTAAEVPSTVPVVTDAQMWALIVGFGLPMVVAILQQPQWSNRVRVAVSVVASIVAGAGTAFFTGEFTGRGILSCALVVCVASIATYQNLWKPTKIAPMIEAKTTLGGEAHVVTTVQKSPTAIEEQPGPTDGPADV